MARALVEHAVELASERGFTTFGALTNDEVKAILEKHGPEKVGACVLGNVLCNKEYEQELQELQQIMEEHAIPVAKCPSYGDSITPLVRLGLYQPFKQPEAIAMQKHMSGDPNFELPANFGDFPETLPEFRSSAGTAPRIAG